jgi:CheY-like chemotaxis protein
MYSVKNLGYESLLASCGNEALDILRTHKIDAVISDINMPNGNGIELLNHVRKEFDLPVVLMTGLSDLKEAKEALAMGTRSFLSKPFKKSELAEAIDLCLSNGPSPEAQLNSEMIRLHLEEFLTGSKIDFGIYMKTNDSFIKISSGGENLTNEDIHQYRENGIDYLYTRKDEFVRFLGIKDYIAEDLDRTKKKQILVDVKRTIEDLDFIRHYNEPAFLRAQAHVLTAVDILTDNNETNNFFSDGYQFSQRITVSMLTSMISQYMGSYSTQDFFELTTSSLLQKQSESPVVTIAKTFLGQPLALNDFPESLANFSVSTLGVHDLKIIQAFLQVFKIDVPQELVDYQLSKLGV